MLNPKGDVIQIDEAELNARLKDFDKMIRKVDDPKWIQARQRYYAAKRFVEQMRAGSPAVRLKKMITTTTKRKFVGSAYNVRVGVVKNDAELFPKFSAQALASVLEYGTEERFRQTGVFSAASTGRVTARRFLRPAFDGNVKGFMDDVERAITKRFEEAI